MSLEWLENLHAKVTAGTPVYACPGTSRGQWILGKTPEDLLAPATRSANTKCMPVEINRLHSLDTVVETEAQGIFPLLVPIQINPPGPRGEANVLWKASFDVSALPPEIPSHLCFRVEFIQTVEPERLPLTPTSARVEPRVTTTSAVQPPGTTSQGPSKTPSTLMAMGNISSLNARLSNDGGAILPAGTQILHLLGWDTYRDYDEVDSRLNYYWKVELALQSHDDRAIRVRQTILLLGHGTHRKHEVLFSFNVEDLAEVELQTFKGRHPGRGLISIPHMYQNSYSFEPASVRSEGPPIGLGLNFKTVLRLQRWSCLPITAGIIDQEMSVFDVSIWFAKLETAQRAQEILSQLSAEAPKDSLSPDGLGQPESNDSGPTSLGGITRF